MEEGFLQDIKSRDLKIECLEEDQKKTEDAFNRMKMSVSAGLHQNNSSALKIPANSPNKNNNYSARKPSGDIFLMRQTESQNFDQFKDNDNMDD